MMMMMVDENISDVVIQRLYCEMLNSEFYSRYLDYLLEKYQHKVFN